MRADVVRLLLCPHCGSGLSLAERSLQCATGHSFDIARQGYVNLLPGDSPPGTGDTASMVRAREAFLEAGHFSGLHDAVAEAAGRAIRDAGSKPPLAGLEPEPGSAGGIIDVGAGTGYYLAGVLDRLPDRIGLALDLSKFALRRAARAHERMGAAACDTWRRLPVRGNCAALILDAFAPRNPPEFRRIIEPEGRLLIVTPTNRHLAELIPLLGLLGVDTRKQDRLDAKVSGDFALSRGDPLRRVSDAHAHRCGHAGRHGAERLSHPGRGAQAKDGRVEGNNGSQCVGHDIGLPARLTVTVRRRPQKTGAG